MTVDRDDAAASAAAAASASSDAQGAGTATTPRSLSLRLEVWFLVVLDALVAAFAACCGLLARSSSATGISGVSYVTIAMGFPALWTVAMALGRAYDRRFLAEGSEEYRRVLNAAVWLGAGAAITSYVLHLQLSRSFVGATVPIAVVGTLICRHLNRRSLHRHLAAGATMHRVVVVGSQESADRLARHMGRTAFAGYVVVAVTDGLGCGDDGDPEIRERQTAAAMDSLIEQVRRLGADTIAVVNGEGVGQNGLQRLSWQLEGTGIKLMVAPNVADVAGPRILVHPVAGLPMLHIKEPEFHGMHRVLKGCIDRLGAGLLLLVASPVLTAIAVTALMSHGRPILYRQGRVGKDGRRFVMHKFRTMRTGADRETTTVAHLNVHGGPIFKIPDDPRITRLGRVLRRYSLDELPQLWDVLRGSMSLVGPRPPLVSEVEQYGNDARRRLLVKPGITGLWQVSGRSDLSWEETVRLDLHYVENWSVALDLVLLWRTVFAVATTRGAY
jgi:exopolysaccharide biosynthesis polyprenyl glycosylphosphotransferase